MALIGNRATATFCAAGLALATCATAQIRVVTTIPDFANIVQRIGGDAVTTTSLTKGHEDLHLVRIRPSLLIKLRRAGAFVQLGLDGEHAWVPAMMRTARNRQVQPGRPGFCDASLGIAPLQVPAKASRGAGPDLHPRGNPHYNVDPIRMRTAARNIRDCLIRIDPTNKRRFAERCAAWEKELDVRLKAWHKKLAPFRGAEFIEAHSSWIYFAQTFGLNVVARYVAHPRPSGKGHANRQAAQDRIHRRAAATRRRRSASRKGDRSQVHHAADVQFDQRYAQGLVCVHGPRGRHLRRESTEAGDSPGEGDRGKNLRG